MFSKDRKRQKKTEKDKKKTENRKGRRLARSIKISFFIVSNDRSFNRTMIL